MCVVAGLIMWGIPNVTDKSSRARQLAPQLIGFWFIFVNSWGIAIAQDNTGTVRPATIRRQLFIAGLSLTGRCGAQRLFGERNYMLFVFTIVCFYCLQVRRPSPTTIEQGRL